MGTRDGSLVGDSVTLGLRFMYNEVLADAFQIIGVQILDPQFKPIGFIPGSEVVRLDLGTYQVIAPGNLFQNQGVYHDVWQIIPVSGGGQRNLSFDINVVSVLPASIPNFRSLLNMSLADLTAPMLKQNYLWPVWTTLSNGWYLPDRLLQFHIDRAITWVQREIGIPLKQNKVLTRPYANNQLPTNPVIGVDYDEDGQLLQWSSQYSEAWSSIRLAHSGVQQILSVRGVYAGQNVYNIPDEWVDGNELRNGIVRIRPTTAGTINQIVDNSGQFLDVTLLEAIGKTFVPGFWAVDYIYGNRDNIFPLELGDAVMKKAACLVLDQLGMAISRGISSRSAQVDGLGSNIGFVLTAERTQFGALVKQYMQDLAPEQLIKLRQYYRTPSIFLA